MYICFIVTILSFGRSVSPHGLCDSCQFSEIDTTWMMKGAKINAVGVVERLGQDQAASNRGFCVGCRTD